MMMTNERVKEIGRRIEEIRIGQQWPWVYMDFIEELHAEVVRLRGLLDQQVGDGCDNCDKPLTGWDITKTLCGHGLCHECFDGPGPCANLDHGSGDEYEADNRKDDEG